METNACRRDAYTELDRGIHVTQQFFAGGEDFARMAVPHLEMRWCIDDGGQCVPLFGAMANWAAISGESAAKSERASN